jgi:PITH domain
MSDHHHSHDHGHDHSHGEHDHSHDAEPALQSNLYAKIDFDQIVTLNESEPKSGSAVVRKTWAQRLDNSPELISDDDDEQLLMHVPFVYLPYSSLTLLTASTDSPAQSSYIPS